MASRYTRERILSLVPSQTPSEHLGSSNSCQGSASGPKFLTRFQPGGFHSNYFLVRKKDGSFRPILDLRRLNKSLKRLAFRMLRIVDVRHAIEPGMWFTSVDLKDVYFHIAIAPHQRRFLRFTFQSRSYQFRVLPFGLSLSPRVFTCVIQVTLEPLQWESILILP